jgi:hypothetical protein
MALFKDINDLVDANEIISTDRYLGHTQVCSECAYCKSDFIYKGGLWRGKQMSSLREITPALNLILGHSDKFINWLDLRYFKFLGFRRVFGVNLLSNVGYSRALPLGLTNSTLESDNHKLFGNHDLLKEAFSIARFPTDYSGKLYGNFSIETNPRVRLPIAKLLQYQHGTFEKPEFTINGRVNYLCKMADSNFVICPEGNGIDTHRIWEALYMGSIPIIQSNSNIEPLLSELPVLVIDDWGKLKNHNFLEENWYRLVASTNYNFEWLKVSKWVGLLH